MVCLALHMLAVFLLLGTKISRVHASCVPKLNDGGVLNWELGAGESGTEILTCSVGNRVRLRTVSMSVYNKGYFRAKDGPTSADELLVQVTQVDHSFTEPSILQDILSTGPTLRLEYEAASATSGEPDMYFLWTCEVSGGTTVADYYSSGVELYSVTTSEHIRQVFIPRHSSSFLLGVNIGALGFTGHVRILRGTPSDTCGDREILLDQLVQTSEYGEPKEPPYSEDVVDGSPSISAGFHGANLQLVRFNDPIYVGGGNLYTLELIPNDFSKFKASFGTSISGDDEIHDIFLHHSSSLPSDAIFQFDFLTYVPGLENEMVSFNMSSMDTAYLNSDSLANQPSLSIHQGTRAIISINDIAAIQNVVVVKGNSIITATMDGYNLVIDAIKAGIDNVELFNEEGGLLASLTVYVTKLVEMTASVQYITPGEWSNPNTFYEDGWDHTPQSGIDAIKSQMDMFKPLGITFDVNDNGLVVLNGMDIDGDGTLSSRSEWTDDPFLNPPPERSHLSYPPDAENYFVNIYAVRQYDDTSITGSYGGGGGTSAPQAPGRGKGGAFVKVYKNKTPNSMASTLMHEVGHCLGLAHHSEWYKYPAMALRSTKRNKNLMAVGRTDDDILSPRQWLNIQEMARMYAANQQKQEIITGECDCTAPCACTGSSGCLCGGGDISDDPLSLFEKCSYFGVCLGGLRYESIEEINNAVFESPLCAQDVFSQPDICSFEPTLQPHSQSTSAPIATPTNEPTSTPSKAPTQGPTSQCLLIQVHLQTDNYPSETSWEIRDVDADIVVKSGGGYSQQRANHTESLCLDDEKCFVFIIYDNFGDGICCGYGEGSFSLELANGDILYQGSEFGGSAASPSFGKCSTPSPTLLPSMSPSKAPTQYPSQSPSKEPTKMPSASPSKVPSNLPTTRPTTNPTPKNTNSCLSAQLNIQTDDYPEETSWEIRNIFLSTIAASGGNYTEKMTSYNEENCLDKSSCYEFKLYDSFGDGICCKYGSGSFSLQIDDTVVHGGGEFGSESQSNNFGTCEEVCFDLVFLMDNWPTDITWNVTDSNNGDEVVLTGGNYTEKGAEYTERKCLASIGCYTVNINDIYSDGLCCGYGEGSFSLSVGGSKILTGSEFGASASSTSFGTCA